MKNNSFDNILKVQTNLKTKINRYVFDSDP